MKKTTIYLEDDEAERLQALSARTGKPQTALIREGLRRVLSESPEHTLPDAGAVVAGRDPASESNPEVRRHFESEGAGRYEGDLPPHWTADELYAKVFRNRLADERDAHR
jgi:hypothetical protein